MDAEKQPRGEGFELRTDSWGAIRAQKGILSARTDRRRLRAGAGDGAGGQFAERCGESGHGMGSITQTHHNVVPDTGPLSALTAGASDLKQPTLLMSAPMGIAAVTPETTSCTAVTGCICRAWGGQHHHGTALFSECQRAISLLAQQEGMRLVSAKGPLEVESHGDILSLTALKDITVQSTQGHLRLTAKNGITPGCGGAYIRLTRRERYRSTDRGD